MNVTMNTDASFFGFGEYYLQRILGTSLPTTYQYYESVVTITNKGKSILKKKRMDRSSEWIHSENFENFSLQRNFLLQNFTKFKNALLNIFLWAMEMLCEYCAHFY